MAVEQRQPPPPLRLLIYAHSADERLLYARTLARSFPDATIEQFGQPAPALLAAETGGHHAAIVHFTNSPEAVELLKSLRRQRPELPIIAISGVDRAARALAAGATRFVLAQEWLLLGRHVADLAPASPDA